MKAITAGNDFLQHRAVKLVRTVIAGYLLGILTGTANASVPAPGGNYAPTNIPLASWTFRDQTNWTSDKGYAPVSFTNLNSSYLGSGAALVVDTNVPAWLQYNVYESDGTTNLTVDSGSITFWFAPSSWSSTNLGGMGPGEWGRLLEVGSYTPDSSYGLWSIYVDDVGQNIYFSAQTNNLSSNLTTYVSAPISWTTNYFHFVALTYSATNTAIYLDGVLATNGPGITVLPGQNVLANGFYIGSDSVGIYQADGMFNTVATYSYPLSSDEIQTIFNWYYGYYQMSPWNVAMWIISAPSSPSTNYNTYDIITGTGNLHQVGTATAITSTNVWITNAVASVFGTGTNNMRLQFTIQGGFDGALYDTFVNSILDFSGDTNKAWAWMGQGIHGNTYGITNLPNTACFLILGTPQDSDYDGLTDAYERLVSKTNPYNADTDGDGISDSDEMLNGTNPLTTTTGWMLDSDNDGLPDSYENANATAFSLSATTAEAPPTLPTYSVTPVQ